MTQACALDSWSPGIGDPTIMGWVTVLVYILAALVAAGAARRAPFPIETQRRERAFWHILTVLLLALAVNKQLDLQSYMTAFARCMAKEQGWYQGRRVVQVSVILGLIAAMGLAGAVLWRMMRGTLARNGVALVGMVFVLGFVAARAVGFHHMDALLKLELQNIRLNWLFELAGPILIIAAGLRLLRRQASAPRPAR